MSSNNIVWHDHHVSKDERSDLKGQSPCILWFTGLSGSGKSTVANAVEVKLAEMKKHTYLLDGDNVRHGLNKDLGFSDEDRMENIRRIGEVSALFVDAGVIVLTAFISPFLEDRDTVRALVKDGEFIEVFVDTPLEICEQRDPKGLYAKARRGEIPEFTGISSPYEAPEAAEIHLKGDMSIEASADAILDYLRDKKYI
ncbi:MAG: adenylyl-sulfate kinase [Helicobacteraceae bacterium 4484_230]|nr:MAG: adenylyl-sulfate kinase [Helicobacteraceae bacterium 4484_230]